MCSRHGRPLPEGLVDHLYNRIEAPEIFVPGNSLLLELPEEELLQLSLRAVSFILQAGHRSLYETGISTIDGRRDTFRKKTPCTSEVWFDLLFFSNVRPNGAASLASLYLAWS